MGNMVQTLNPDAYSSHYRPSNQSYNGEMSDPYVIWAVVCLALALVLFFVEFFVPSGGGIGIAAGVLLITGIVLLFMVNTTAGMLAALVVLLCIPFFIAAALRFWPETPIARWLTLQTRQSAMTKTYQNDSSHPTPSTPSQTPNLTNARGKAITELRPVGICLINGERIECLAETGVIHAGTTIHVVSVDGMQIKVKALKETIS